MKKYLIIILIFTAFLKVDAQNDGAGNTGLVFLRLPVGARAIAMGDAYSSIVNDGTAYIYNPARLSASDNNNVTVMFNKSMVDMTTNYVGLKVKYGKIGFGIGLLRTGISDIEVRQTPGAVLEKFDAQNFSGGLSASYEVYKNLYAGITAKFLYEKIYIDEASGFGLDFGTNYIYNNFSFSAVLQNIGSMNELKSESSKMPTSIRFGGSYKKDFNNFSFTGAAEGFKVFDGGIFHLNFGAEGGYKDIVFLRAGYQTGYENKGFSAGLGLKYKSVYIDYAIVPYSEGFGTGNTISLGFNF